MINVVVFSFRLKAAHHEALKNNVFEKSVKEPGEKVQVCVLTEYWHFKSIWLVLFLMFYKLFYKDIFSRIVFLINKILLTF